MTWLSDSAIDYDRKKNAVKVIISPSVKLEYKCVMKTKLQF